MTSDRTTDGNGAGGEDTIAAAEAALKHGLDEAETYLKRQLEERPLTVAATALGLGLLIGLLIGGGRK